MKLIDPHIHMISRTTDDYEKLSLSGVKVVIEPSFWVGQPRTSSNTLIDYWDHIINFEHERAKKFGIRHYCAISVNPKEANNIILAKEGIEKIRDYLVKKNVVALGEIGFDLITEQEKKIFFEQLVIAAELNIPVIVHTPHVKKLEGLKESIKLIKESGISEKMIILDHNTEETIDMALSTDSIAGLSVYPETKLSPIRVTNILKKTWDR